jgi:hypothetical protein
MAQKKNDKQELASAEPRGLSTHVNTDYGDDAGRGMEHTDASDLKIPYLAVLQKGSPECDETDDAYIPDAKPGMLMNSVTKELYDGKKGVIFVPCHKAHCYVEWRTREQGGGLAARHDKNSPFVHDCKKASGKTYGTIPTPEGTELVETKYLTGYLLDDENSTDPSTIIVLSFSSTKLKKFQEIYTAMNTVKGKPPLYAHRLRVTTVPEKNQHGSWYNFQLTFLDGTLRNFSSGFIPRFQEDGTPHPLAAVGKKLLEQMESGQRQFADESVGATREAGTSGYSDGDGDGDGQDAPF